MMWLRKSSRQAEFERKVLPHLDAAYNLARFLMRNDSDAEDVVQDASLRAFRFFEGFRGENSRAWFLTIVRNTAFTALKQRHVDEANVIFDEEVHSPEAAEPEVAAKLDREFDQNTVRAAIEQLPAEFLELVLL